jgi:hypothetical protein
VNRRSHAKNPTFAIRLAGLDDTHDLASLLHAFNTEFATPTPGVELLAPRLSSLLAGSATFAALAVADNPISFALWRAGALLLQRTALRSTRNAVASLLQITTKCHHRGC